MNRADPDPLTYGKPASLEAAQHFCDLAGQAFGIESSLWRNDTARAGWDNLRLVTRGGETAAGLVIRPTAQWYGGRRIEAHAIAAVVTAVEHRGRGAGRTLLIHSLREARDTGVPLSILYASTPTFYRGFGYEQAGQACYFRAAMADLPPAPEGAVCTPLTLENAQPVRDLYHRFAARHPGCLDRGDFFWRQHLAPLDGAKRYAYRIDFRDRLEGYVCFAHGYRDGVLTVQDAVAESPRAARAALGLMRQHASMARAVVFPDGPRGPLHKLIPEHKPEPLPPSEPWMLRITDPALALSSRGYPPVTMELHLDINDTALPENAGPLVLRLQDGQPIVEPGGAGTIGLDARGLAALFTGYSHPAEVRDTGLLTAPDEALAPLALAFAGPQPFMLDKF